MEQSLSPAAEVQIETRIRKFPWLNVFLFLATCLSTLFVGVILMADFNGAVPEGLWNLSTVLSGLPFSVTIMAILFCHEMGHYLTCRYYGIDASLPYFIPFPSLVGTMGAFIRIRSPIHNRGALLDVGVAGPIAGFVVAVAALVVSIGQSHFVVLDQMEGSIELGEPLIFKAVEYVMGMTPPAGMDTYMHPIAFAAWFGFLATALNLLPAAQLDGGHIAYAIFQSNHRWISRAVVAILVPLGIFWPSWMVWVIFLLLIKLRHPPTIDDTVPLQRRHLILGWIALAMLILCFTPAPIRF